MARFVHPMWKNKKVLARLILSLYRDKLKNQEIICELYHERHQRYIFITITEFKKVNERLDHTLQLLKAWWNYYENYDKKYNKTHVKLSNELKRSITHCAKNAKK
uniref:Uncharacterized protein n=1 Tax=viral metagenome TaxID=1070528 RepID=A0A6C0CQ82_9ZZZZ